MSVDGFIRGMHYQAETNLEKWGDQDARTLILAMYEELGELAQAYLQTQEAEVMGSMQRVREEAIDLGALMYQYLHADQRFALERRAISCKGLVMPGLCLADMIRDLGIELMNLAETGESDVVGVFKQCAILVRSCAYIASDATRIRNEVEA